MKDKKRKKQVILEALLFAVALILIIFLVIISFSKIKLEGNCKIDKLSFDINETNKMENLSLSNGEIDCGFKIEVPLWVVLVGT